MRIASTIALQARPVAYSAAFCVCAMAPMPGMVLPSTNYADVYRYAWEQAQRNVVRATVRFPYQPSLN